MSGSIEANRKHLKVAEQKNQHTQSIILRLWAAVK
jgi:hypothetical protein